MLFSRLLTPTCQQAAECQVADVAPVLFVAMLAILQSRPLVDRELPRVLCEIRENAHHRSGCALELRSWMIQKARRHAFTKQGYMEFFSLSRYLPVASPIVLDRDTLRLDFVLAQLPKESAEIIRFCYMFGGAQHSRSIIGQEFTDACIQSSIDNFIAAAQTPFEFGQSDTLTYDRIAVRYLLGTLPPRNRQTFEMQIRISVAMQRTLNRWEGLLSPLNQLYGSEAVRVDRKCCAAWLIKPLKMLLSLIGNLRLKTR